MGRQHLRGRLILHPSLTFQSWATGFMHLPLISLEAETWITFALTGEDNYVEEIKISKERALSTFEKLKPEWNRMDLFSISSFEHETVNSTVLRRSSGAGRNLCCGMNVAGASRAALLVLLSSYTTHAHGFSLLVPLLLHQENGEQWHLPTSGGDEGFNWLKEGMYREVMIFEQDYLTVIVYAGVYDW